jgi:hypothetical protein
MRFLNKYMGILLLLISICYAKNLIYNWQSHASQLFSPKEYIKLRSEVVQQNIYNGIDAEVRFGNELHPQEQEYLKHRKIKVQKALEKIVGISLEDKYVPTISLICSGGGYRAMLGSLGSWAGLQHIGVLDAVMYISALSGSTWALGLWMSTGMPISRLKNYVSQRLLLDIYYFNKQSAQYMAHMLATKIAFNQPCTTVDLFGALIANHLLGSFYGKKCQMIHMSEQMKHLQHGNMPFPIYTAVDGRMRVANKAPWYEFTPLEVGSSDYDVYVPTWACGRYFSNGKSIDYAPEQSLGFFFGVFGSAFGAHVGLAWDRLIKDLTPSIIRSAIEAMLTKSHLEKARVFWAKLPNYMFGLNDYDISNNKYLKLIDAGIEFNLPYPPVSGERFERMPDVLIFFDFSRRNIPYALKKVEEYAHNKGLKFPHIDYHNIEKKTISVFKDQKDTSVPVVIYIPRISDKSLWEEKKLNPYFKKYKNIEDFDFNECAQSGHCHTLNFRYTLHQSKQVMNQMEFNVIANKQQIIDVIKWVIERKSKINENQE